jgi:creatinine amidohydrolase/Fe(II)-dependent formamide hydrolase-like protein
MQCLTGENMRNLVLFSLLFLLVPASPGWAGAPAPAPVQTVWLEEMTWPEIKDALAAGKTTAIIPTGGTEQNGPHIVLGKHNFILKYTAMEIARRLGNALVAPIMEYVPEGDIHPPTGHMRFPGTLSLRPETFAAVLEDTARSLKEHGFKIICFVGEHGASQAVQQQVAAKLDAQWKSEGVRVIHVGDYYDEHNGQMEWARKMNITEPDIEAHGGLADTAEMLAAYPQGVRMNLLSAYTAADMQTVGAGGSALGATHALGAEFLELKIRAAVQQIQLVTGPSH